MADRATSTCQRCGAAVTWRREGGKLRCLNAGSSESHWDSCSNRRWSQTKATGQRFERKKVAGGIASGYADSVHGTKFDHIQATHRTRPARPIVECPGCVPPWEVCPRGCPNAITRSP